MTFFIAYDELFLKVDNVTRTDFEAEGCAPFTYDAKNTPMVMSYYRTPGEAMDAPHLIHPWARLALEAALRMKAAKAPPKMKASITQNRPSPKRLAAKVRTRR